MSTFFLKGFPALGVEVENLFAAQEIASSLAMTLTAKSLGTKNPPVFLAGTPKNTTLKWVV